MGSQSPERFYVSIWVVLLVALFASLGIGLAFGTAYAVAAIFAIAVVKAALVALYYMHLVGEPTFIRVLMTGTITLMLALVVGTYADVAQFWSGIPRDAMAATGHAVAAGDDASHADAVAVAGDPARGAKVYATYCVSCHQADGRGNEGKLAANFVDDPTRLAKTDAELIAVVREGTTGSIGTMPPWGAVLSAQQSADVVAHLRAAYGP